MLNPYTQLNKLQINEFRNQYISNLPIVFLSLQDRQWVVATNSNLVNIPNTVDINSYNLINKSVTNITINSNIYTLNLANCSKLINIELNSNCYLYLSNYLQNTTYYLKIKFNNYKILNLYSLFNYTDINHSYFNSNYEELILEINFQYRILADIKYNKQINKIKAIKNNSDIIFTNSSFYQLTSNQNISQSLQEQLDVNNNWQISLTILFSSNSDYGELLSIWTNLYQLFKLEILQDSSLIFNYKTTNTEIISLSTILTFSNFYQTITIQKVDNILQLIINGVIITSIKLEKQFTNSTVSNPNLNIGYLSSNSYSNKFGYIVIKNSIDNYYSIYLNPPTNQNLANNLLLLRYDIGLIDLSNNNYQLTNISNDALTNDSLYDTASIGFANAKILSKFASHEIDNISLSLGLGSNLTIECWIYNHTNNSRGTIVSQSNWDLGIYDDKLKLRINELDILISNSMISYDTWVHICYIKEATNHRFYINGIYDNSVFSSSDMTNSSNKLYIKKNNSQDSSDASLNSLLYPSKSHISISQLRFSSQVLYTSTDSTQNYYSNYFSYM